MKKVEFAEEENFYKIMTEWVLSSRNWRDLWGAASGRRLDDDNEERFDDPGTWGRELERTRAAYFWIF